MKIAVNVRLLKKNKLDGIGWFSYNILKRLVLMHPEHTFYFIFDSKYDKDFVFAPNVKPVVVPFPTKLPILWWIWLNITVPIYLFFLKPDIFFSPDGFLPSFLKCKKVIVIHDINFEHYPKDLPFFIRLFYRTYFKKFAQKADNILTVSNYSKKDLVETYGIDENKIEVVYNDAAADYRPLDDSEKLEVKKKYTKGSDYLIFVGNIHPRKNIKRLILAFEKFKQDNTSDVKLVIVGSYFFKNKELFETYKKLNFKNEIIFTGRLEIDELTKLMGAALALVFVPYFEGFGMPLVEAMKCNVPIIASNQTSIPEVVGEAALLVNPFEVESITNAIKNLVFDVNLRQSLIQKGTQQAKKFSWDNSAQIVSKILFS